MSETIVPKSDQLNAEDLLTGPRTFTVEKVTKGSAEQPVDIHLVEFPGRPFRPSKTVRRILVAAWGADSAAYVGRRMTLYRDPAVKFGGMDVGGIRVSHLSHIDKPLSVALTVTRGKRQSYKVMPLADAAPAPKGGGLDPEQSERIAALMRDLGITTAADALAYVADVIGRGVESRNDLTAAEATRLIEHMALALGEVPSTEEADRG
jgi:hypothetical protein